MINIRKKKKTMKINEPKLLKARRRTSVTNNVPAAEEPATTTDLGARDANAGT